MTRFPKMLGLIPARKESKGIPFKNMKMLDEMPLIQYTIESALQSELLHTTVVSTDCENILDFAGRFQGVKTPFLRPGELSLDTSPTIDVVRHAVAHYQSVSLAFDYVVLLQPTCPFRRPGLIDRAICQILHSDADSLISVRQIPDTFNPYWAYEDKGGSLCKVMDDNPGNTFTRRQDLPDTYYRDGEIYITKTALISEGLLTGGKITALINTNPFHVNLDTMDDWAQAVTITPQWKNHLKATY